MIKNTFSLVRNGQSVLRGGSISAFLSACASSQGPTASPASGAISVLGFGGVCWLSLILICLSLAISDVKRPSLCLCWVHMSLMKCPFLIRVFIFLLVESEQFLFALDNLPEQVGLLQIFCSRLVACLFRLLIRSLGRLK